MLHTRTIKPGERVRAEFPHSEVCMYMKVAGKIGEVELLEDKWGHHAAQLWVDGREFSFPIGTSEAGIFDCAEGHYIYEVLGEKPYIVRLTEIGEKWPWCEGFLSDNGGIVPQIEAAHFASYNEAREAYKQAADTRPTFRERGIYIPYEQDYVVAKVAV